MSLFFKMQEYEDKPFNTSVPKANETNVIAEIQLDLLDRIRKIGVSVCIPPRKAKRIIILILSQASLIFFFLIFYEN